MALYFDWVVSGKRYRAVVRQRDELFRLVLRGQGRERKAADLVEAAINTVGSDEGMDARGD